MSQSVGKVEKPRLASSHLLEAHQGVTHLVVQGGRSCLHTDTAIRLTSRLLGRHQILGVPVVPLKACLLNHTEMSCYFSHLSVVTGRGELEESLKLGFLPLHPVETLELLWAAYHKVQRCLKVAFSQTLSQIGILVRDIWLNWQGKDPTG